MLLMQTVTAYYVMEFKTLWPNLCWLLSVMNLEINDLVFGNLGQERSQNVLDICEGLRYASAWPLSYKKYDLY